MKFEEAMKFLKQGIAIYRSSDPEKGCLRFLENEAYSSFYLTLVDILADDWECRNE